MIKIAHRINTIQALKNTPSEYGVECDLRSDGNQLIVQHDPFQSGEKFTDYLARYKHQFMIVNTKEEGLEESILEALSHHNIKDFFFLDLSLPYLVRYAKKGVKQIAVRYSSYEPLEFSLTFSGLVDWVWVDCFEGHAPDYEVLECLQQAFKVCLVSPELQGCPDNILAYKEALKDFSADAVCTKTPDLW